MSKDIRSLLCDRMICKTCGTKKETRDFLTTGRWGRTVWASTPPKCPHQGKSWHRKAAKQLKPAQEHRRKEEEAHWRISSLIERKRELARNPVQAGSVRQELEEETKELCQERKSIAGKLRKARKAEEEQTKAIWDTARKQL